MKGSDNAWRKDTDAQDGRRASAKPLLLRLALTTMAGQIAFQGRPAMDMRSAVREFLSGKGPDNQGRSLKTILAWSDDELEFHHDFIQWLFPLEQASRANLHAPVLAPHEFKELGKDPHVIAGLRAGFRRMLDFYGLELRGTEVVKSARWRARSPNWAGEPTHNDLRITRILRSLSLFGMRAEASALLGFLEILIRERPAYAGREETLKYWRNALRL